MAKQANVQRDVKRFTISLDMDTYERLKYWAARKDLTNTEYIQEAIDYMIAWENKDYDLPTAEIARLNQIVDGLYNLSSRISSLEKVIISGFKSLLGLTRGDNYLLEEDVKE